jgi:hypothetical protein
MQFYFFCVCERAPGTHWAGGWVDLGAGLDDVEERKFLPLIGFKLRQARSQSLYRLSYRNSSYITILEA